MAKMDVLRAIEELLEVDAGTLKGEEGLADLGAWNSLSVLGFIAMADEKYGVAVAAGDLAKCATVNDLVALL
jgi:acyl carrier protein